MKVLVTGAKGMLGTDLAALFEKDCEVVRADHRSLDITDPEAVRRAVGEAAPDVVVNAAAYTAVDRAEREKELAFGVNARGAGNVANACAESGARLVQISTDYVFDGAGNTPYREDDPTGPLCVYGASKLEGEQEVMARCGDCLIVRTSWLYGHNGRNFIKAVLAKAGEGEELRVVYDQTGSPTYTVDLAQGIAGLVAREAGPGIYHFSNEGVASWYDLACRVMELAAGSGIPLRTREVVPVLSSEYPTVAKRPRYSVLDKARYRAVVGAPAPSWMDAVRRYMEGTGR